MRIQAERARKPGWAAGPLLLAGFGLLLWVGTGPAVRAEAPAPPQAKAAAKSSRQVVKRRDPFKSLLGDGAGEEELHLPPGKRGLVISRLSLDGVVIKPHDSDRIAVVTMRGRNRAYFLRVQDELYDGYVAAINEDGVVFKQKATDAFGKPYEREVTKQLSGSGAKQ